MDIGQDARLPEISREKILELLEDFGRRFKSYGYSERSYWYYRFRIFMDFGELEEAGRSYDRFRTMDRDFMSDCEACEQDEIMRYFLLKGDDEKVLEAAQPILKGRMSCAEIPHLTLSEILMPLYRLGRTAEADKHQIKGYRLIKGQNDFVQSFAEQMDYLTRTNPAKGIDVLEETLVFAADHEDPYAKMLFYARAASLLRRWVKNLQNTDCVCQHPSRMKAIQATCSSWPITLRSMLRPLQLSLISATGTAMYLR